MTDLLESPSTETKPLANALDERLPASPPMIVAPKRKRHVWLRVAIYGFLLLVMGVVVLGSLLAAVGC